MPELVRTQIMLEKKQHEALTRQALREGRSLSDLVREAVDAQLRRMRYLELQQAAALLRADYAAFGEIKDLLALDGQELPGFGEAPDAER